MLLLGAKWDKQITKLTALEMEPELGKLAAE